MLTLQDAKTVLFVDNTKTEARKSSVVGENGVSANHEIDFTRPNRGFDISLVLGGTD